MSFQTEILFTVGVPHHADIMMWKSETVLIAVAPLRHVYRVQYFKCLPPPPPPQSKNNKKITNFEALALFSSPQHADLDRKALQVYPNNAFLKEYSKGRRVRLQYFICLVACRPLHPLRCHRDSVNVIIALTYASF